MNTFEETELLTFTEITTLLETTEPTVKASLISNKIKNILFMYKNFTFKYNKEVVAYDEIGKQSDDYILTLISSLITQSKSKLTVEQDTYFRKVYPKTYLTISKLSVIKEYLPCVNTLLADEKYKFTDPQLSRVHFRNGYFDLKTGEFKTRIRNVDFVNFYINRDYKKASKASVKKIMDVISQIYTEKEDREYLLQGFGIAMTGLSTQNQQILYLLGKGSAGKSTVLSLMKLAFDNYVIELDRTIFSASTSDTHVHKILNTFLANRNIRITHINEPKDTKMDETLFKDFVDGNIKTTSLFKDGLNSFKHMSKVCMTANTMPKIKMDSGVVRRIEAFKHTSIFTNEVDKVDEEKRIFKKDEKLLSAVEENEDLLNAICDIIFSYATDYSQGKIYKQTQAFRDIKEEIVFSNDVVQDFVSKYLVKTENPSDKVGKTEMYDLFKLFKPKSLITEAQLRDDLQNKDFKYEWKPKKNGIQGVFTYCRINDCCDSEMNLETQVLEYESANVKLTSENNKLKAEMEELKKQLERLTFKAVPVEPKPEVKKVEPKPEVKKVVVVDDLEKDLAELMASSTTTTKTVKPKSPTVRVVKLTPKEVIVDSEDEDETKTDFEISVNSKALENFFE